MPAPKFTVTGTLVDFGGDPRPGVKIKAVATPGVKIGDEQVHSNFEGEVVETDDTGAFEIELSSIVGVWYLIAATPRGAMNAVRFAGYTVDPMDPTTGVPFADGHELEFHDLMDEQPTPGYEAIMVGGVIDHGALLGLADDDHPQYHTNARGDARYSALGHTHDDRYYTEAETDAVFATKADLTDLDAYTTLTALADEAAAREAGDAALDVRVDTLEAAQATNATDAELAAHAADTTNIHGIADTSALVLTSDARLSDARTPTAHTHTSAAITDFVEAAQDAVAALLEGASGVTLNYDDAANTLTITGGGSGGLDEEAVRDAIGVALIGAGLITVTVNDALDTITISTTATANSTDAALRDRATHTGVQAIATVDGLQDELDAKADVLGPDDNYVTDAEKAALHTHPAFIGQGATAADARTAIGAGNVVGTGVAEIVTIGQAAYDALTPPSATTLYLITGA